MLSRNNGPAPASGRLPRRRRYERCRAERTALQITKLIEHEQGVQALGLEVRIPNRAFLVTESRTFGTVHVERDELWRLLFMRGVDPAPGQLRQRVKVRRLRQHLSLEPPHGWY